MYRSVTVMVELSREAADYLDRDSSHGQPRAGRVAEVVQVAVPDARKPGVPLERLGEIVRADPAALARKHIFCPT